MHRESRRRRSANNEYRQRQCDTDPPWHGGPQPPAVGAGLELALEMLVELEEDDGSIRAELDAGAQRGYRNIVLEYLQRAQGSEVEVGFTMVRSDMAFLNMAGNGVVADRYRQFIDSKPDRRGARRGTLKPMGLRFYRRLHVIPGVRLNIGSGGASVSFGHRGAWLTVGPHGRRRAILGWPGPRSQRVAVGPWCCSGVVLGEAVESAI